MIASHVTDTPMGHLMLVMGIRGAPTSLEAITLTSDGWYMGQLSGDLGYNVFLGRPNSNPLPETRELLQGHWNGLTAPEQDAVLRLAVNMPDGRAINVTDFVMLDSHLAQRMEREERRYWHASENPAREREDRRDTLQKLDSRIASWLETENL